MTAVMQRRHDAPALTPGTAPMRAFGLRVPPVSAGGPLRRAVGYYRFGEGSNRDRASMLALTAIGALVRDQQLFLTGVHVDDVACPAGERPALNSLLTVIDRLDLQALIVPSSWHLSQCPLEVADIRTKIGYRNCELLIVRGAQT